MHAVVIYPEGDAHIVAQPEDEKGQYDNARLAIKCSLIERVRFDIDGTPLDMWVDEEGLLHRLPYNSAAVKVAYGDSMDGLLVGIAYVTGPNLEPMTLEQAEAVMSRIGEKQ